ncbi:MAG TPA: UDP-glucose 4-epimerase GalE [Alphaproteobacteria bacterium]|nr:UDP-glucose 4-epimerase GalE [Alphaproteobacteria bacterium]HAJ45764.1 UDP-glucose 4-epimerase GalE [Alphaproteobacteria bacterium]
MAVLVTGGAGYIGSHMVLNLLAEGLKPVVLDDLSTGFEAAVPSGADLFIGDVGDNAVLERIFRTRRIEAVIHFAASAVLPDSVSDPLSYYSNNTAKTRTLLAACVQFGVKSFIFSSTAAVYGTPGPAPLREEEAVNPPSPYGRSKFMVEWMLADVATAHGLSFAALRYFNVAGADPGGRAGQSTKRATNLIKVVAQAATGLRPSLDVYGDDYDTPDGTGVRDYVHVSDLVSAHTAALEALNAGSDNLILNVGYGRGYSVLKVLRTAERVAGVSIPITVKPRRPGDLGQVIADNTKIKTLLNWTPAYDDLDVMVGTAINWERTLIAREPRRRAWANM